MTTAIVAGVFVAALVSYGMTWLVVPILYRYGVVDIPNTRSSHYQPIARGGGLAVGWGVGAGSVVGGWIAYTLGAVSGVSVVFLTIPFVVVTWAFSAVGLIDDLDSMSVYSRLGLQVIIAGLLAVFLFQMFPRGILLYVCIMAGTIALVNGVNFMDGLNTMTSGWACVTGSWYCFVLLKYGSNAGAIIAAVVAAASAGFIPHNIGRARAFLGDVGSFGIGAAFAAIAAYLLILRVPLVVVVAPLVLLIFDVALTLLIRLHHGENLFLAHRGHIYQRAHRAGLSHLQVAAVYVTLTGVCCVVALPVLGASVAPAIAAGGMLLVVLCYASLPRLVTRWRQRSEEPLAA